MGYEPLISDKEIEEAKEHIKKYGFKLRGSLNPNLLKEMVVSKNDSEECLF